MPDNIALPSVSSLQGQRVEKVKAASLSQLVPRTYSTVRARVVIIKCKEKDDELGKRQYIFGIYEDSTFRVPFVCYSHIHTSFMTQSSSSRTATSTSLMKRAFY